MSKRKLNGEMIRAWLWINKMTIKELATALNSSESLVHKMLYYNHTPKDLVLNELGKVMKRPVSRLFLKGGIPSVKK